MAAGPTEASDAAVPHGTAVDAAEADDAGQGEEVGLDIRFEGANHTAIDAVTIGCAGDCVDVEAVVRGGHPPYSIEWDDGSTSPIRHVCAEESTSLSVRATDTPVDADEFSSEAQTVIGTIEARVFECTDGGACEPGYGPDTPESGHYGGSGTYVCDNDTSTESAMLINHIAVSLDFDIVETALEQSGHAYFQWGLIVIAGEGDLEGTLECGGALRASLQNGTWGLPGPEPMTVIPTGGVTGEFTARRSGDGTITGSWFWVSTSATGDYGNTCNGTFEAQLVP